MSKAATYTRSDPVETVEGSRQRREGGQATATASYLPFFLESRYFDQSGQEKVLLFWVFPCSIVREQEARYVATVPALPGVVAEADTRVEAKRLLGSALKDVLELHDKRGTHPSYCEPEEQVPPSSLVNIHVECRSCLGSVEENSSRP